MQPKKNKISLEEYHRIKKLFKRFRDISQKDDLKTSLVLDIKDMKRNLRKNLAIKQTENGYPSYYR